MTVSIPQLNTAPGGSTFTDLFASFNQMANAISSVVITAAATSDGGAATGNSALAGIFSATVLAANTIRGGSVSTPAPLVIATNTFVNGSFSVGNSTANTIVNSSSIVVNNATIQNLNAASLTLGSTVSIGNGDIVYAVKTTNTAGATVVDSFPITLYRGADYFFTVRDLNANTVQTSKMSVLTDGATAYSDEYSMVWSDSQIGTFASETNATSVYVTFTSTSNSVSVKAMRTSIKQ